MPFNTWRRASAAMPIVGSSPSRLLSSRRSSSITTHAFIVSSSTRLAKSSFFTADEEHLRDWLRRRDASPGKYTLATASHELNYLAAYWTVPICSYPKASRFIRRKATPRSKSGWLVYWPSTVRHRRAGSISICTATFGTSGVGESRDSSPRGMDICTICFIIKLSSTATPPTTRPPRAPCV